ncbi:MAG: TadE family type IV pilus minor pilin [Lapillicoccus sp.]
MVTVELAVAIPAVVLILALVLGGVSLGVDRVRCVDAARLGARALARGDSMGSARAVAGAAAPPGAQVSAGSSGGQASVTVTATRRLWGAGVDVSATSVADLERRPDGGP